MKRLYYFRHSVKDGVANTLGPNGLELAEKVGAWMYDVDDNDFNPSIVFTGPLIRTVQTAYAFMQGVSEKSDDPIPVLMPVIPEIGDDTLFGDMMKPSQIRSLASSVGNYRALLQCHDGDVIDFWIARAAAGLRKMVGAMMDDDCAVAFGHSPVIELTLAGIFGKELPEEFMEFSEMEGVLLTIEDDGKINVIIRKISMPATA